MRFDIAIALLIMAAMVCSTPVAGQEKYLGGSPELSAHLAGTAELSSGQDAVITVVLQNSGTNDVKFINQGTLLPDDLSTTAKLVTVGLSPGNAPVVIKTGPQNLGDIPSPGAVTATFAAKITSGATLGEYQIPLSIRYKYLSNDLANQETDQIIQSQYTPVSLTVPLTIRIQPAVQIAVVDADPSGLAVGTEGFVNLTIRNTGYDDGKQATVTVLRNDNSAVIPTDSNVYIGDFPRNSTVSCLYRVTVSGDAQQQVYPVDVIVTYINSEGSTVTSAPAIAGVPVKGKLRFTVTSPPAVVTQGTESSIIAEYRNDGTITAGHAEARISGNGVFISPDNTAYLGDVPPGGKATARFSVLASGNATPGPYALDTVVSYQDTLDNSLVTDTFGTPVTVVAQPGTAGLLGIPATVILIIVVLAGAGYYLAVRRRKR